MSKFPLPFEFRIVAVNTCYRQDPTFGQPTPKKSGRMNDNGFVKVDIFFTMPYDEYGFGFEYVIKLTENNPEIPVIINMEMYNRSVDLICESFFDHSCPEDEETLVTNYQDTKAYKESQLLHEKAVSRAHSFDDALLTYNEATNMFRFIEYVCLTPTTSAALDEIRLLRQGINYTNVTDESRLIQLLKVLDYQWH